MIAHYHWENTLITTHVKWHGIVPSRISIINRSHQRNRSHGEKNIDIYNCIAWTKTWEDTFWEKWVRHGKAGFWCVKNQIGRLYTRRSSWKDLLKGNTLLHHVTSLVTHGILNVYWWWNPIGQCHGNRIMSYQVAKTHPMKRDNMMRSC